MSAKVFLDTNVVVYLYSGDEPEKQTAALSLIENNEAIVSTQVLSELANTLSRKFSLPYEVVAQAVAEVQEGSTVSLVMPETIAQALTLAKKYQYSYYDSQILASALLAGCSTLFTEDIQHGQLIENSMTICNPFRK